MQKSQIKNDINYINKKHDSMYQNLLDTCSEKKIDISKEGPAHYRDFADSLTGENLNLSDHSITRIVTILCRRTINCELHENKIRIITPADLAIELNMKPSKIRKILRKQKSYELPPRLSNKTWKFDSRYEKDLIEILDI